jgi:hypothetical protein
MFVAPTRGATRRGGPETTKDFDYTDADKNDPAVYNRALWQGTMGDKPYPTRRSGLDLRRDREALLHLAGPGKQN